MKAGRMGKRKEIQKCKNQDYTGTRFFIPLSLFTPFNFCTVSVMLKYFVPAFLYCLYNNLAFVNLSAFDPTTYYLMLQLRVVVTGVLFQVFYEFISATRIFNLTLYFQLHSITVKSLSGVCIMKKKRSAFIE